MNTATRFVGEVNARNTLIRLGEFIPTSLTDLAIWNRYGIGITHASHDTKSIRFVDGSTAKLTDRGWKPL